MLRPLNLSLLAIFLCACQPRIVYMAPLEVESYPSATAGTSQSPQNSPLLQPSLTPTDTTSISTATPVIKPTTSHISPPITTLLFTGVIVPARCVQAEIDAVGDPNYIFEDVRDLISQANIAIGTFNATMSDYPPHTGCIPTYILVGSPANADALALAGFDVMSVATNHIKDCGLANCGNRAFYDTLDNLRRVNIQPVGAGSNLTEALQPVVITANGIRFGIVSQGQIRQGGVYAEQDEPGIAELSEENIAKAVDAARQVSDVVIFMPHWGPENVATPTWIQRDVARQIVNAGADLVIGNHTHVVQGVQEIDGVMVFYGLGNFVFDQWERPNKQGVLLMVKFEGTRLVSYELIPTHVDRSGRVYIAGSEEAAEILERIEQASQSLQ